MHVLARGCEKLEKKSFFFFILFFLSDGWLLQIREEKSTLRSNPFSEAIWSGEEWIYLAWFQRILFK